MSMTNTDIEKSWTIVAFSDEGTVEAIPSSWIIGDICHYPPSTLVKVAIKKNEPFNRNWPKHKIRTFRNGTYGKSLKLQNNCVFQYFYIL